MSGNSPRRPLLERLEDRRYAAGNTASGDSIALAAVRVSIDSHRALHVVTTNGEDGIRIRGLANGYTQIDIGSLQTLPSASTALTSATTAAAVAGETLFAVDRGQEIVQRDGDTVLITRRYTIPTRLYVNIAVDGGGGHDLLRLADLPVNPIVGSIERSILTQTPAPVGETPSDPITTGHFAPGTGWAIDAARQKVRADNSTAPIAFVGDSHAAFYTGYGRNSWLANFSNAINLGLPGDSTRQLLTRIQLGLFAKYKPRKLIVMIGANNFNSPAAGGTDEQIYKGVVTVLAALRDRLPHTQLVLVGVLPQREAGVNERVQTLDNRMARRAAAGGEFAYVKTYDAFAGNPANDALIRFDDHMTPAGYDEMTKLLTDVLRAI